MFSQLYLTSVGNPDAINDILNNSRYEGAISSISKVTNFVDEISIAYISFIAFMIITVAIMRNVLAGAYSAFPKFFDQVHEAHEEVRDQGWGDRIKGIPGQFMSYNAGTIKKVFFRLVPDIKVLTDFEDEILDVKAYFISAIAKMIGVICVGVFIYNGYYRDTAVKVAEFGSEIFTRTIMDTDPVAIYDRIMNTASRPDFSTDNALDNEGKAQNKLAKSAYNKIIGTYTDVRTASAKSALVEQIEAWIKEYIPDQKESTDAKGEMNMSQFCDENNYDMSYAASLTYGQPKEQKAKSSDGLSYSFTISKSMDDFQLDSTKKVGEPWCITLVVNFAKKASTTSVQSYTDLKLHTRGSWGKNSFTFTYGEGTGRLKARGTVTIVDSKGKVYKGKLDGTGAKLTFTSIPSKTFNKSDLANQCTVKGLNYIDSNNEEHQIAYIKFSNDGKASQITAPTLIDSNSGKAMTFTLGEPIQAKNSN